MPIISTDILYKLSGGAANSDPNASLGGVISSTSVNLSTTLHNLFDQVSSSESSAGDTEYRCLYVLNNHGTLTLQSAKVWIETNTPSTDTSAEIALGTSTVGGTEQTVSDESTAPTGVSWSSAAGESNALTIGDIAAGSHKAIWVKRVVSSSASAYNNDGVTIRVKGDTAA